MSTYYFLLCDTHKEKTDAASRTAGGYCPLGNSRDTLTPFLIAHAECNVRILSEHRDDVYDSNYREWTSETVEQEIELAKRDGRWL